MEPLTENLLCHPHSKKAIKQLSAQTGPFLQAADNKQADYNKQFADLFSTGEEELLPASKRGICPGKEILCQGVMRLIKTIYEMNCLRLSKGLIPDGIKRMRMKLTGQKRGRFRQKRMSPYKKPAAETSGRVFM
jgi:hypothetical protein